MTDTVGNTVGGVGKGVGDTVGTATKGLSDTTKGKSSILSFVIIVRSNTTFQEWATASMTPPRALAILQEEQLVVLLLLPLLVERLTTSVWASKLASRHGYDDMI